MANTSVDGLVSGLDTTTLINQLVQLERQPQVRLQSKVSEHQKVIDAYRGLNTKFAALQSASDALSTSRSWGLSAATSSAPDSVVATAATGALTGSFTFSVRQLATAHTVASSGTVASTSAQVATGDITVNGTTFGVGDGSLGSVVGAINARSSALGVKAAAVQVAPNSFKLQLTSTSTGASTITTGGAFAAGMDPSNVVTTGQDALLDVGSGPGAYQVRSATNTVTGVLSGVTLTLKKADPAVSVTVDVATDSGGLADKAAKMVESANAILADITKLTAYNPTAKTGAILTGDSRMRTLAQNVRDAVGSGVPGIERKRDGTISFDRAKFLEAYTADPEAVSSKFVQQATAPAGVEFIGANDRTAPGSYDVTISQAARRAEAAGTFVAGGAILAPETISVATGTGATRVEASYDAAGGESLDDIAAGLNQAISDQGLGLVASVESGALVVRSAGYGADQTFQVASSSGQTGLGAGNTWTDAAAGADVAGTIHGVAATGKGQVLSVPLRFSGEISPQERQVAGLSLRITAATTGSLGQVEYRPGIAQKLDSLATETSVGSDSALGRAITGREGQITDLNQRIAGWDVRIAAREQALRRQYAALETALSGARSQSNWLAGQISSLPTYS